MLVYRFSPQDRFDTQVALTTSETGDNLPATGAPWRLIGQCDLDADKPWVNAPVGKIKEAMETSGFFLWSFVVPSMGSRFAKTL